MKNEKGQTTVEYILLLSVIVAIMTGIFSQLEQYIVSGPNSLTNQFTNSFQGTLSGGNARFQGQYKYFKIRR